MAYISDEVYKEISEASYKKTKTVQRDTKLQGWEAVEPEGAVLHGTRGFDATVFYNEKNNQVVIGFRGTEPQWGGLDQTLNRLGDFDTDLNDIVRGRFKELKKQHEPSLKNFLLYSLEADMNYRANQFYQAQKLYDAVKKQYPTAEITSTGHSLGGALTQYVAVNNGIQGVTFSAPSVTNLLTDEQLEKLNNGEYDKQIINYVHPSDSVGAGALGEYKRHVGSTYYVNLDFQSANEAYYTIKYPTIIGGKVWYIPGQWGPGHFMRVAFSFMGSDDRLSFHSLENFTFDSDGNINNTLIDRLTGEPIQGSPRWNNYIDAIVAWEKLKNGTLDMFQSYSNKFFSSMALLAGSTIELQPEALKEASSKIKLNVQEFQRELPGTLRTIQSLLGSSRSRSLEPIVHNTISELNQFIRWYATTADRIAQFINKKADDFIQADRG